MIHILIVEDEKPISNLIRMSLTKAGYSCMCAYDGEQALDMIKNYVFDLILLDVMIPKIDGFSLMQYIRPMKIPVIFLTAKNMVEDRVRGLELGAEDYLAKPFEIIELLARVNVVLRRYNKTDTEITIAGLTIDTKAMIVYKDGYQIPLTPKEYELLRCLLENKPQVLTRDQLLDRVWGTDYFGADRVVDNHIKKLRQALGNAGKQVRTVITKGYQLIE